ncbi:MAG: right-handed parallel beta-helix repeat-containing protein, partial [Thermoplasmata archaeon]|nr:right-handed parallel beta-helix repeat-containing protein [Thermoplasmata archaeon]
NNITNNHIASNAGEGFDIAAGAYGNNITGNNITDNTHGVSISGATADCNNVIGNNISGNNQNGIYISVNAKYNNVTGNRIVGNSFSGIRVWFVNTNNITDNNISSNTFHGLEIDTATNLTIRNNTIVGNTQRGIFFEDSDNCTATLNNISGNQDYGAYLQTSVDIQVYHNEFWNNINQAYDDGWDNNSWDNGYPSGGNFWDDYTGIDLMNGAAQDIPDPDGIGDTHYNDTYGQGIQGGTMEDNYPLMMLGDIDDNYPPVSSVDAVAPYWHNTDPLALTVTAYDARGTVTDIHLWYSFEGGIRSFFGTNSTGNGFNFDWPAGEGNYSFYSNAEDDSGNMGAVPLIADTTAGYDITVPSVDAGADLDTDAQFPQDGTASDLMSGIASYQWTKVSGPGTITFGTPTAEDTTIEADTDGTYIIQLSVTDNAGNNAVSNFTLTWDTTDPLVDAGPDVMAGSQFLQDATASDATIGIAGYSWTMVSGPGTITFGSSTAEDTTVSADEDGVYVIQLSVTDSQGNEGLDTFELIWDATPPVITVSDVVNGTGIWFNITETNLDMVYYLDGTENVTLTAPYFIDTSGLALGFYNYTIWAWDMVDQSASTLVTIYIGPDIIPSTAPTISGTLPIHNSINVSTITSIVIIFSQSMDTAAVQDALDIDNLTTSMTMAFSWNADNTILTIHISPGLASLTTYQVTIDTGAEDASGTAMESDYIFSFTTISLDTDGDGTPNHIDTDDDDDGVLDTEDDFPLDDSETVDTDGDGTGNNADTDDDGDGTLDAEDAFPLDAAETLDTDGDGTGNNADTDDDGDGTPDDEDSAPLDPDVGGSDEPRTFLWILLILAIVMIVLGIIGLKIMGKKPAGSEERVSETSDLEEPDEFKNNELDDGQEDLDDDHESNEDGLEGEDETGPDAETVDADE